VGPTGKVYANDILEGGLAELRYRAGKQGPSNITTSLGTETDPRLPRGQLDMVFLVRVLHDLTRPVAILENLRVRYTTSRGVRLAFSYRARRLIDDKSVDFNSWPLYSGPFINAGLGDRVFVLTQGGEKLVLDFNDFSVR
jgi:ubiquinone/menaquinone biosynthesis C-methylase UbiE